MPIHERTLRALRGGQQIESDRPCRRCGYNLVGLRVGQPCPECGTPIRSLALSGRFAQNMVDAPLEYLRPLRWGLLLLSGSILLGLAAGVASLWMGPRLLALVSVLCGPMWFAGTWQATRPRPLDDGITPDSILDHPWLRHVIRAAQSVSVLAAALLFMALVSEKVGGKAAAALVPWLYGSGASLLLLATFSLVPFGLYLSALSDWAGHGPVSMQFRLSSAVIAIFGSVGLVAAVPVIMDPAGSGPTALVGAWSGVLTILGAGYFLVLVLRLTHSARWAVNNALSAMERDARVAERHAREADAMVERMGSQTRPPPRHLEKWESEAPIPLADPTRDHGQEPPGP